jgi:hypothetical protein
MIVRSATVSVQAKLRQRRVEPCILFRGGYLMRKRKVADGRGFVWGTNA